MTVRDAGDSVRGAERSPNLTPAEDGLAAITDPNALRQLVREKDASLHVTETLVQELLDSLGAINANGKFDSGIIAEALARAIKAGWRPRWLSLSTKRVLRSRYRDDLPEWRA